MSMRTPRPRVVLAALPVLALTFAGCGAGGTEPAATDDGRLTVVASTNVWGSVVRAVGGDAVAVTEIIDAPGADPHSYESTPRDAADVAEADLVVFNGGGYDEFMEQILETGDREQPTVEAFALADQGESAHEDEEDGEHTGEEGAHAEEEHGHEGGANEHVWYDLPTVETVAERVAEQLGELDPDRAAEFTANAEEFHAGIDGLLDQVGAIAMDHAGEQVASTEPLAFYLIEAAGLRDGTPAEFVEAVEEETDPPAGAVAATRDLVTGGQVRALIFNSQTETPVTAQVRTEAETAGVPVVEMTETLPDGAGGFLTWMTGQVEALSGALAAAPQG